jgi:glutathione gamma-glutamylcysteinyltransferase
MHETLYRRPLPSDTIAFSSTEGKRLFGEALAAGGLEGYFRVAEQFHTQSDPSFCGLGSLVVALNALGIDPGRLWKGPWRWFSEELLDCCVPLEEVRKRGVDLDELGCLARCNGAEVELVHADGAELAAFRAALRDAADGATVLIASYDRAALEQTGTGHFSPVGGYHAERDLVLILDVARFKYPPHWVSAERLFQAMRPVDPVTGRARGWLSLRARQQGLALGFSITCDTQGWGALEDLLRATHAELKSASDLASLSRAVVPLLSHVELRKATAPAHRDRLTAARAALAALPVYGQVERSVGGELAEATTLLLLAIRDRLTSEQQSSIETPTSTDPSHAALELEVNNVRAQLAALWMHARGAST